MRAVASQRSGTTDTTAMPTNAATHAAATATQRRRQTERRTLSASSASWFMDARPPSLSSSSQGSEPALGNDDHVARLDIDVGADVPAFEQILQVHAVLLAALGA